MEGKCKANFGDSARFQRPYRYFGAETIGALGENCAHVASHIRVDRQDNDEREMCVKGK